MIVKEPSKKGETKNLYPSELEAMCKIKNVPDKARDLFKRKPYEGIGKSNGK